MQKKLIALAVAALASGAAFAQSNVQIYGSIDMGFSHRGDAIEDGIKSQNAIDSGISAGNRLGFKGTEDLGNGLKALFTMEAGFQADTGEHAQSGALFGRQVFVGLTGGFGTAIAGRLYTPHYSFLSTIDPFKAGTVGRYNNTYGIDLNGLLDPVRVDNAVAYVSPSFSGFNVTAAYSNNAIGQEVEGNGKQQNRVYAILPRYTNGPIDVALNYHQIKMNEGSAIDDITNWLVGGTYDFGMAKLAAFYSSNKIDYDGATDDLKVKNWMLGVTVPFGKHAVLASYNYSKAKQAGEDGKSKQWALGYTYSLSKRTNIYAAYADISNDDGNDDLVRASVSGDASNKPLTDEQGYQNGFQFGVKHTF
ncbi:porin [Azovibrio restrictus]|uniref:porin n=1 Tax=Azovibrio restrictus TaxID=146938 RepID=UPI0026F28624|nr:porin [Azovibrio restrictus]MDD3481874.1 porin [Azovibrio restrictus]